METEAEEPKLHPRHGEPCANPECQQPLQTGKIRGVICTRDRCKQWLDGSGLKKTYKCGKGKKRPHDENAQPHQNGRHPQQAWAEGARSRATEPPTKPKLVRVFLVYGVQYGENKFNENNCIVETHLYHIIGLFRTARSRASEVVAVHWVDEEELFDVLDPDEGLGYQHVQSRSGS